MWRGKKVRKEYPEDFKTMFGLCTMTWAEAISGSFMTGLFMLYLTDYAGIGSFAAKLGTILLSAGRFVDAIDDPLQGFIMDNKKPGKYGKYKPFIILSIIMMTAAICALFSIPSAIAKSQILVIVWVSFFYLMYDIGVSFFAENPLKQSLTDDPVVRARMTTWPRVISMVVVIPMSFFMAMLTAINKGIGDMHKSFSVLTFIISGIAGIVSLIGICLVKEGKHIEQSSDARITLRDAVYAFKKNKPLLVSTLVGLFHGFVWTLVFSTTTYYIKWAYCTDLSTGVVNSDRLGFMTTILGIIQLIPTILMAAVSPKLVKVFNGPVKVYRLSMQLEMIGGLGLFICMVIGALHQTPVLFFIFITILLLGAGLSFVPGTLIGIECMDYGMYITGKEEHALINSIGRFIAKAQTALSSMLVGAVLIAVGYQVDSVTDTYIGDLSAIPGMLNSFIVVSGLVPAILCLISIFILRYYPIDGQLREEINTALRKMKEK